MIGRAALAHKLAQRYNEISRRALYAVGASFQFVSARDRAHGHYRQRFLDLLRQTLGLCLRLLFRAGQPWGRRFWCHDGNRS